MDDKNVITMTLKNLPNGGVEIQCSPSFEMMMNMIDSGHELTPAHGYLMAAANVIRTLARNKDENMIIKVPKLGRA